MYWKTLSRRDFIKYLSCSLSSGYITLKSANALARLGSHHGGPGWGGGGESIIIDPPIGDLLQEPVEISTISSSPGVIKVNLETTISLIDIRGIRANLMTYNGSFPGPTIRVKKGDILNLRFTNSLPNTNSINILGFHKNITNLHTHGWHVSPEEPADNVLLQIMPGETYNYSFDTSLQKAGTFNYYHPHVHGLIAEQMWAGLFGALIVEDEDTHLDEYETHILILKDISLRGSDPEPYTFYGDYICGKQGDIVMVNGQVNPRLNIESGQVQRWRILNASTARIYKLNLEDHNMYLIGTDGGLLDKPYERSELLLSPGERVDVLVKAARRQGSYRLRALPYISSGMGMGGGGMGMCNRTPQTITLMTLLYDGRSTPAQSIPALINPDAERLNPDTLDIIRNRTFVLSMEHGRAYINRQDFDVSPYTITSDVGTFEIWTVINLSGMDHPFHQHINAAQIISIYGGNMEYASLYSDIPAWKDTILVPAMGIVTMLVPVIDYTGTTMYHCHILEHEDIGMMGVWQIK